MTYKTAKTGIQQRIVDLLRDNDPKALWTVDDLKEVLDDKQKSIDNAVYIAWQSGKICRHKERELGKVRYAFKIADKDKLLFEERPTNGSSSTTKPKKRKGYQVTAKEVRMLFAEMQRKLMQLEDSVMARIEEADETEKNLNKLRNLL